MVSHSKHARVFTFRLTHLSFKTVQNPPPIGMAGWLQSVEVLSAILEQKRDWPHLSNPTTQGLWRIGKGGGNDDRLHAPHGFGARHTT